MGMVSEGRLRGIGPLHILVVEDDASINKLLRILLEKNGYRVDTVEDYSSATAAIEAGTPSLILLDIGLPDGNGLELLRWMRDQMGLTTPVIVLSAFRQDANVEKAFDFGANDFVAKPFRPKELISRIERALGP